MGLQRSISVAMLSLLLAQLLPAAKFVDSAPITIDFSTCRPAQYQTSPIPGSPTFTINCCPLQPTKPIVDGVPPSCMKEVRMRKASQCTDLAYAKKLARGYELMRGLPADDPRSFSQQWFLHCSYCGGSFLTPTEGGNSTGIDVHFSWLFYPWHRFYLYFHERILQSLLDDPTFSLSYWNWDNPFTVGTDGGYSSEGGACLKAGNNFPANLYGDALSATYTPNRSENAKGKGRLSFPDLTFSPVAPAIRQPLLNVSVHELVASNLNVMYMSMVSGGTTQETFLGRPYGAGSRQAGRHPAEGAGTLEQTVHTAVHSWTGRDPPNGDDMGTLFFSARDPVFYAHHSNIDRLWEVWKSMGPSLHQSRVDYSDTDYLNTTFLFYDENKDLRRVRVADALNTTKLGYVYQAANDEAWMDIKQTKCSNLSSADTIAKAQCLPAPAKDANGAYHLQSQTPFVILVDRPANLKRSEEFLTIRGINFNRMTNVGFDVFVNFLDPNDYTIPWKCGEYGGRFMNMAMAMGSEPLQDFEWQESISEMLVVIGAQQPPSKLAITIVPLSSYPDAVTFKSIAITT